VIIHTRRYIAMATQHPAGKIVTKGIKVRKAPQQQKPITKPWQGKVENQKANALQKKSGGRGVNPIPPSQDLPQGGGSKMIPEVEQLATPIVPEVTAGSIKSLALGAVLMAIVKGFGTKRDTDGPFLAYNYLVNVYSQALKGSVPAIQIAPAWFWETIHMLRPKSFRMKTGTVAYSWEYTAETVDPLVPYGGGFNLFFGVPSLDPSTEINGFMQLVPPGPYTDELGQRAFQATFIYFEDAGMYKRIADPGERAYLHRDVSAFQASYPEWGGSQLAPNGGQALSILSEVRIQNPMLSKFASYQLGPNWRGFQSLFKNAGTPCYIAPRMASMLTPYEISTKHSPIFKFYNFDHFYCQLSYTLAKAMELANEQQAVTPPAQCPLTPWEVQVLLRQAILNKFDNVYAQDMLQQGNNTIPAIPLSTCVNGCSITLQGYAEPVYPRLFTEMIRAIKHKVVKLRGTSHVVFLPILTRPIGVPQMGNFQYKDRNGSYVNLYNDTRTSVDVSLIDLSDQSVSPTRYITLNYETLASISTTWNNWIRTLQPNLTALQSLGNEDGIALLNTVFCTQHVVTIPTSNTITPVNPTLDPKQALVKRASKTSFRGDKLERKNVGEPRPPPGSTSEYYKFVTLESITSLRALLKPEMKYVTAIVKPTYMAQLNSIEEAGVTFQQVLQIEPFAIPQSSFYFPFNNSSQPSLDSQFLAAATYDTRQLLSQPSEIETDLDQLQRQGSGGFFTSLAGSLGSALGWKGATDFFDQVGKVIDV